nr:NADH dehydrogenase subunit 6 [Rhabdosynochus viridisi]
MFLLFSSLLVTFCFFFAYLNNFIHYCLLLVVNSLLSSLLILIWSGNPWFTLIFYMVYVGGVYILFVFLSVFSPNIENYFLFSFSNFIVYFFFGWEISFFLLSYSFSYLETSQFLCSYNEGYSYLLLCSFLLLGFFMVSFISSSKEQFIR